MNKRFYETEKMFRKRCDLAAAKDIISGKKLWRINAIEMLEQKNGGWQMGRKDHFTVEACSEEMAIGVFKYRDKKMSWFVTDVKPETVAA